MLKAISWILLISVLGVGIWVAFALWVGIYSVYSIPPTKEDPEGSTLLVSRDEGEPMFNSPDTRPVVKKAEPKKGGIGFGGIEKKRRPLALRTIVTLPYIDWAYRKSLEAPAEE